MQDVALPPKVPARTRVLTFRTPRRSRRWRPLMLSVRKALRRALAIYRHGGPGEAGQVFAYNLLHLRPADRWGALQIVSGYADQVDDVTAWHTWDTFDETFGSPGIPERG